LKAVVSRSRHTGVSLRNKRIDKVGKQVLQESIGFRISLVPQFYEASGDLELR